MAHDHANATRYDATQQAFIRLIHTRGDWSALEPFQRSAGILMVGMPELPAGSAGMPQQIVRCPRCMAYGRRWQFSADLLCPDCTREQGQVRPQHTACDDCGAQAQRMCRCGETFCRKHYREHKRWVGFDSDPNRRPQAR